MSPPPKKRRTAPRRATVSDQLREIIRGKRLTPYAVARAAEVSPSILTRFVNGERGLATDTFDRVADALGLELKETRRGARGRGRDPVPMDRDRRDDGTADPRPGDGAGARPDATGSGDLSQNQ